MRVLVVCAANVCRSPMVAQLLQSSLAPVGGVEILSAGVAATPGAPACPMAAVRAGFNPYAHRSRSVTAEDVASADLLLAADTAVRSDLAVLSPPSRRRTFTVRQAAAQATELTRLLRAGRLPDGAGPIPIGRPARAAWLVDELDAARGRAYSGSLDIADPHAPPTPDHRSLDAVPAAVWAIATLITVVLGPEPPVG